MRCKNVDSKSDTLWKFSIKKWHFVKKLDESFTRNKNFYSKSVFFCVFFAQIQTFGESTKLPDLWFLRCKRMQLNIFWMQIFVKVWFVMKLFFKSCSILKRFFQNLTLCESLFQNLTQCKHFDSKIGTLSKNFIRLWLLFANISGISCPSSLSSRANLLKKARKRNLWRFYVVNWHFLRKRAA